MIDLTRILVLACTAFAVGVAGCDKTAPSSSSNTTEGPANDQDQDTDDGHDHGTHDGHDHDTHEDHDQDTHEDHDHDTHEDHDHDTHEDHDHDTDEDHDQDTDDEHDHDANHGRSLGTFEIAGTVLSVSMSGAVKPNAELHLNINYVRGPMPEAIRLWVGAKSGEGSLKSKADSEGDHWHGHTECPGIISNRSELWIEVEDANGKRVAKGLPLG